MVLFFKVHSASYMKDEFWGQLHAPHNLQDTS